MRSRTLASLLTLAGLFACAPQDVAVDLEAARSSLRDADALYTKSALGKDLEMLVGLYAPDGVMYPPETDAARGLDAIRAVGESFMADPAFTGTFTPVTVEVSAQGDMGYTLNSAELTVTGEDGQPVTERIRDFHVWRREPDGAWKLVVDIWNAEPPAGTPSN